MQNTDFAVMTYTRGEGRRLDRCYVDPDPGKHKNDILLSCLPSKDSEYIFSKIVQNLLYLCKSISGQV
jgi:hypothetical protein